MLSGRSPPEPRPIEGLDDADMEAVLAEIRGLMASPERMREILQGLGPEALAAQVGEDPFNIADWLPWVDRLTLSVGVQFQDLLANQIFGVGGSVRLPFYDPASKDRDGAYRLEAAASMAEMKTVYGEHRLRARKELLQAQASAGEARTLSPYAARAALAASEALSAYRNGLISEGRLREAFSQWRWYTSGILEAESRQALAAVWQDMEASFGGEGPRSGPAQISSFQEAFDLAALNSTGLEEVGYRREAAALLTQANDHRIQKFYVDLHVGYNLTASGVGWLPSFGITGLAVTPIATFELKPEELRELQVRQGKGQGAVYDALKTKLEIDLSVDIFRNAVTLTDAEEAARILEEEVIPQARERLEKALRASSQDGSGPLADDPAAPRPARLE